MHGEATRITYDAPDTQRLPRSVQHVGRGKEREHFQCTYGQAEIAASSGRAVSTVFYDTDSPQCVSSLVNPALSFTAEQPQPGITLNICDCLLQENFQCSFTVEDGGIGFITVVSGNSECSAPTVVQGKVHKGSRLHMDPSDMVMSFYDYTGDMAIFQGEPFRFVSVVLAYEVCLDMLGKLSLPDKLIARIVTRGGFNIADIAHGGMPAARSIALQILQCRMVGYSRKLFMESKCLELLSVFFDRLHGVPRRHPTLARLEVERLYEARRLLLERMANPPSICELAMLCGTNEFSLKRNYKLFFGQTMYETLRKERLERARKLIADGELTIGSIAHAVGYTLSHFVTLFKREFGVTPGKIGRNRM